MLCFWWAAAQSLAGLCRSNGITDRFINVNAIQGNVRLIFATTIDVAVLGYTWLQSKQTQYVASFHRQLGDLLRNEVVAQTGVLRIDLNLPRLGSHLHDFVRCAYLQDRVHHACFCDQDMNISQHLFSEPWGRHFQSIVAGGQQVKRISALRVRPLRAYSIISHVGESEGSSRDDPILRVLYCAHE